MLKAGGSWSSKLTVPEVVRQTAGGPGGPSLDQSSGPKSFTWIIEVASQILFSTSASVNYEVLVGRDEKSVDFGFHTHSGNRPATPGKLEDFQQGRSSNTAQQDGIFSKAVRLRVEDTDSLWNQPAFPSFDDKIPQHAQNSITASPDGTSDPPPSRKRKKVHLVVLTHGLHSNLGSDMLYMKESIDVAAYTARHDARKARADLRAKRRQQDLDRQEEIARDQRSKSVPEAAITTTEGEKSEESDDEDEQVIVRGFSGNAIRTERGIQYLGKRLAKYTLSITYPDQPYLPTKSTISKTIARSFTGAKSSGRKGSDNHQPSHKNSSIQKDEEHTHGELGYRISSISFIGHSLGGLVQTYAIAYIQKHSPEFFELIKPINFVGLASPFLGLSNENPMYVKFALDFGLVGRTGQDLGLTWRAPTVVRSGWGAMIGGLGNETQKTQKQPDPGTKPLLRILPSGPAHTALKKFRNRTLYSNVVNDGIVPLRTSCLLFLDWRGLGRVEKARRDMGLMGTMVGWGWNEMMGANASSPRPKWTDIFSDSGEDSDSRVSSTATRHAQDVPQPEEEATAEDDIKNVEREGEPASRQFINQNSFQDEANEMMESQESSKQSSSNAFAGFLSFFRPNGSSKPHQPKPKKTKIYRRGQTMHVNDGSDHDSTGVSDGPTRTRPVRGDSLYNDLDQNNLEAPPKTTFFESAGDVLNPPLPPKQYLVDPSSRPRTIFHDRVYHPDDIPPPPVARKRTMGPRTSSKESISTTNTPQDVTDGNDSIAGNMKIEEKIARAYHNDVSWRKVLVRLEPDAHNNIIVRRMFSNAYGWPVIQHLVDTHFAYTAAAQTEDALEENVERVQPMGTEVSTHGEHVAGQSEPPSQEQEDQERPRSEGRDTVSSLANAPNAKLTQPRTESEARESRDEVPDMRATGAGMESSYSSTGRSTVSRLSRQDSARWSDRFFEGSDDDDADSEFAPGSFTGSPPRTNKTHGEQVGTSEAEIADFLNTSPKKEHSLRIPSAARPLNSVVGANEIKVKEETADAQSLSLTGVGLQKSPLEDRFAGPEEDAENRAPTMSVSEQIAFASAKKSGVQADI